MIYKLSSFIQLYVCVWTVSAVYGQCDRTFTAKLVSETQDAIVGSSGTCTWTINAENPPSTVRVQFNEVNLPGNETCDVTNSIIVYDGDTTSPILGLVCRSYIPKFMSSGSTLTLRYPASKVTSTSAFSIRYQQRDLERCGTSLVYAVSSTEYSVQSPGYPTGIQTDSVFCDWKVWASSTQRVLVTIETTSTSCSQLNATIVTGEGRNKTWCPGMRSNFVSRSSVRLDFEIERGQSVKVKYRALEECQHTLNATTQEQFLTTPNWPAAYPSFTECRWKIQNFVRVDSSHNTIRLEIVAADMEETAGCETDSLRVIHDWMGSDAVLGTTCGATPKIFLAYGKIVLVVFRSVRPSNTKTGIKIKYSVTAAEPCGGNLTASSSLQNITSPGFPVYYPDFLTCVWTITPDNPFNYVKLEFVEMELFTIGYCKDKIDIYDGSTQSGRRIKRICKGNNHIVKSQEAAATVVFKTYQFPGAKGFKMRYMEVEDPGPFTKIIETRLDSAEFVSPRYPHGQIKNLDMTWTLNPSIGDSAMMLTFTEVDIGDATDCSNNYIKVFLGNTSSALSSTLCGKEKGVYMSRKEGVLTVVMKTDNNPTKRGFKASYRTMYSTVSGGCDGETKVISAFYSDEFKDMQTMNYPNPYPNLANCTYVLESLFKNYFMRVKIADAAFADSGDCTKDYIELFDGDTTEGKKLGTICANTTQIFESTGRRMLIRMISDGNLADRGAKISYQPVNKNPATGTPLLALYIVLGIVGGIILIGIIACVVYAHRKNTGNQDMALDLKT